MSTLPPLPEPPPQPASQPEPPEQPARRSRKPVAAALALLLGLGIAIAAVSVWISRPGRCEDATFTSNRFGYCLQAPVGWTGDQATVGTTSVDELTLQRGPATVFIQATSLDSGQGLDDFVSIVRSLDDKAGYTVGDVVQREVDGVQAAQWDVTAPGSVGEAGSASSAGSQDQKLRVVVFVKDGKGWRVQLGDTSDTFDSHAEDLDQMLETWQFR